MHYEYTTKGTWLPDDSLRPGGRQGPQRAVRRRLQRQPEGIGALVEGMKAEDVIDRVAGIQCGMKSTSCPDQLSVALKQALAEAK